MPKAVEVIKIISEIIFPFNVLSENIKIIVISNTRVIVEILEYFILWMFFAINFEIKIAIKKEIIPEINIVVRNISKIEGVKSGIKLFIATAAPVLVLFIE